MLRGPEKKKFKNEKREGGEREKEKGGRREETNEFKASEVTLSFVLTLTQLLFELEGEFRKTGKI